MNIRAVLLVVLLVIHEGAGAVGAGAGGRRRRPPQDRWYKPGTSGSFYVESSPYTDVVDEMKDWIKDQRDKETDDLEEYPDNPVLKKQFLKSKPAHWFLPLLLGRSTTKTNLAFRSDNLYLSGFTNGEGSWFSFETDGEYVIPESTVLGFRGNYRDLVAGGVGTEEQAWIHLIGLEIGRDAVLDAIAVVNGYNPNTTPDADIKRALATLIVVFMEAQRFPYIRQQVHDAWENEQGGRLNALGAEMVVHWKRTSCALLIWATKQDKGDWNSKEARKLMEDPPEGLHIFTPEQARATIGPVLRSERCTE
ncbi:unnamed protein product [Urochloa decumbens]|uniref:rRNA N-glycosylase n=1 Tax=Urochloa decumbens TaxID=240449 RepID=A0ABC9G2G6_9POAL